MTFRLLLALAAVPALAPAAAAQDVPAAPPTTAPSPAAPTPAATIPTAASALPPPIVTALPPPAATPTPRARPSATATPRAVATPTPRPSARATTIPTTSATPASRSTPTPAASPSGVAVAVPTEPETAPATSFAGPPADPSPRPVPVPVPATPSRTPAWPFVAAIGLAALLALGWAVRRRRPEVAALPAPEPLLTPVSEAAETVFLPPAATVPSAPQMLDPVMPPPGERARLAVTMRPRRAGVNLLTATADIEVTVENVGAGDAAAVTIDGQLMSARAGGDEELARWYATRPARPVAPAFALPAGASRTVRALLTLPRSALNAMKAGEREMFVPVVALSVRYDSAGQGGQTARAWAVGVERDGSDKLAPLWLDAPARMHDRVAARSHGIALDS